MTTKPSINDIHRELRERIILLELPPGSPMREVLLSQHYGVSRTPIRQVLHRLEFEGLVDTADTRGARVSALDPKGLRDTWAIRLRLAELAKDFVSLPANEETLDEVTRIQEELKRVKVTRNLKELGKLYNRFHEAMLQVLGNKTLRRIHDLLYVQTARVWNQFLPEMDIDREISVMAEEVDQVLEALRVNSGVELSRIRAEHMRRLLDRFNQVTAIGAVSA